MQVPFERVPNEIHIFLCKYLTVPEVLCLITINKYFRSIYLQPRVLITILSALSIHVPKKSKGKAKLRLISSDATMCNIANKWKVYVKGDRKKKTVAYHQEFRLFYDNCIFVQCLRAIKAAIKTKNLSVSKNQGTCNHSKLMFIFMKEELSSISCYSGGYLSHRRCNNCNLQIVGEIVIPLLCSPTNGVKVYCGSCNIERYHFNHPKLLLDSFPIVPKYRFQDYTTGCLLCGLSAAVRIRPSPPQALINNENIPIVNVEILCQSRQDTFKKIHLKEHVEALILKMRQKDFIVSSQLSEQQNNYSIVCDWGN